MSGMVQGSKVSFTARGKKKGMLRQPRPWSLAVRDLSGIESDETSNRHVPGPGAFELTKDFLGCSSVVSSTSFAGVGAVEDSAVRLFRISCARRCYAGHHRVEGL